MVFCTICGAYAGDHIIFEQNGFNFSFGDGEIFDRLQIFLAECAVFLLIDLQAQPLHCWTLAGVEHARLQITLGTQLRHQSAKCTNFMHDVPFANTTHGGVAGHVPDLVDLQRKQKSFGTKTSGGVRSFNTCVTTANNNYIKMRRVV